MFSAEQPGQESSPREEAPVFECDRLFPHDFGVGVAVKEITFDCRRASRPKQSCPWLGKER